MKLNKKGYTLIELLAAIVVIGLIIALSTYGIINIIKSSKEKTSTLSENSIKEAAEQYATEKNDDSNYWLDITGENNKYFCITIEELMNKGLLDKKAESTKFKKSDFVLVKKDKITMVNSSAEILISKENEENVNKDYEVCSGTISNEEVTNYPNLETGTSYTDEIHVPFTDAKTNPSSTMTDKVCMYGDSSANIKETGTIEGNTCKLLELKDNSTYYLRVCMKTDKGSYLCSNTESRGTLQVKKPTYTSSGNTLTIKYDDTGTTPINTAKYYFKSTINGTSNSSVTRCTLDNNIFTCDGDTTTIEKDIWYRSPDNQISISYTTEGTVKVTARTVDKSNNYGESTKNITINKYTITFNKGTADKIGGGTSNITKSCYAISGQSCNIISPTIEKTGYTIIGWNTNKSATNSIWNVNTSKSISSNATYYPVLKVNTYTIEYKANGGSGAPGDQIKIYGIDLTLSDKKPNRAGYTFQGWDTSSNATKVVYNAGDKYTANSDAKLYAVWKASPVCGKYGHVWTARGIKKIKVPSSWDWVKGGKKKCSCGNTHTDAYIIYCSKCGMSALYYNAHYSGSTATLMCPDHPYGRAQNYIILDDCTLSDISYAQDKISGGSNRYLETDKDRCPNK